MWWTRGVGSWRSLYTFSWEVNINNGDAGGEPGRGDCSCQIRGIRSRLFVPSSLSL